MDYKLIAESKSENFDNFISTYKENPYNARVMFFNNNRSKVWHNRLVFYKDGKNFSFVTFTKSFGISTTNKMYSHETVTRSLRYKNGKFYVTEGKKILQLNFTWFRHFCIMWHNEEHILESPIWKYFIKRFSWLRFVGENEILYNKSFNTFVNNKLYNYNDAIKYFFKVPLPSARVIVNWFTDNKNIITNSDAFLIWNEMRKVLINVENISLRTMNNPFFNDLCKMARTLDRKVNCGWSARRIREVHDDFAKEITNIVWKCEPLKDLSIRQVFIDFADYSGFKLLRTNKEMVLEGMLMHHCVATYINSVEQWRSAIYHIDDYTLELKYAKDDKDGFSWMLSSNNNIIPNTNIYINQFRGLKNIEAPNELVERVTAQLISFSKEYKDNINIVVASDIDTIF